MSNTNEPRALTAALSSPAFVTKGAGMAMNVANRHVSRWAPEVGEPGAQKSHPLRNLGFVDRLVSPWIESAQRSASLRMFSNYITAGAPERPQTPTVSWVFPRPWYQDELDWMAAARAVGSQTAIEQSAAPQMFTTRGTYVAPQQVQSHVALPSALYEYVAPSLSIARPDTAISSVADAYSPLVPLAATGAAQVVARAMAPLLSQSAQSTTAPTAAATRMSPGLRAVLSTMLERSSQAREADYGVASRVSSIAPEMVTPPAPRADAPMTVGATPSVSVSNDSYEQATQVAEQYAEQRAKIAELQRVARVAAEREYVAREAARAEHRTQAADPGRMAEVRAAEARAIEQRQAAIEQRATEVAAQRTAADTSRREVDRAAQDAERARIEERIAQRMAERQEAQRLHSASRDAAARDARSAPMPEARFDAPRTEAPAPRVPDANRVATEIAAAVAALPPELASMVAGSIGNRPDRAVQAIAELSDALRTVELIARNTASGGSIEPTRGPRLVMPAGLGGLVSTVVRTTAAQGASNRMMAMPMAAMPQQAPQAAPRALAPMRVPSMTFLAQPGHQTPTAAPAPTSALGAATAMTPAALSHVAWSDRWLARFAGAKTTSLDVLSAASASPEMRLEMLAAAAPGTVFVAPFFDDAPRAIPQPVAYADAATSSRTLDALPTLRNAAPQQEVVRFDDNAETPDDVFAAISRARTSGAQSPRPAAPVEAVSSTPAAFTGTFDRETLADLVAHAAPPAPGAGLAAGLASSPFAPALRHVMPVGAAPTFDVRALFGSGLGATFLAGLLEASTDEIATPAATLPTWATWAQTAGAMTAMPMLGGDEQPVRDVAGFDPTYVAPELPRATDVAGAELVAEQAQQAQAQATAEHVTTLRSALLSWDVETVAAQAGSGPETRVSAPSVSMGPTLARSMIETMSLPMLGETAALGEIGGIELAGMHSQASSYAAPGMIAYRALGWSVANERSTSDLSFDFVSPELVLAARVYGLGPAEAAQAARLAIGGPGQLSAMAGAVDRTFVQALAIESERRGTSTTAARQSAAYPLTDGARASGDVTSARTADETYAASPMTTMPSSTSFGVERRAPRGAFLWPAATTAALGLNAAAPDGEMSMSVAALEMLAAQSVAELGTYAALSERGLSIGADGSVSMMPTVAGASVGTGTVATGEGAEADVLASAEAMVPQARREKFQALYLALGQSSSGKAWSPAARAARALALAGRGEETISSHERASIAWDVLPMVYGADGSEKETLSTGDSATRTARRREELRDLGFVDARPGLGMLSARAGEALGSYVAPSSGSMTQSYSGASGSSARGEMGAVMRAPSAAQELVQTGRPSGRHGGGETEIPAWFETAARKMLEAQTGSLSDGISLAELTLVQTAAPTQIAASSRGNGGHSTPQAPAPAAGAGAEKETIDVDKLANEVYREIIQLMELARARNGEPYL